LNSRYFKNIKAPEKGTKTKEDMSKLFYTISEVAETIGVEQSLLRIWEEEFSSFIKSTENAKGVRFYKIDDVEIIKQIHFLVKVQGLTLRDVKPKIKQYKEGQLQESSNRIISLYNIQTTKEIDKQLMKAESVDQILQILLPK
jgi:DNA-binding transcriptional MerR regulator